MSYTFGKKRDPLNFYNGEQSEQKLYDYKLKKFLAECAMGMTSEKPWQGIYDATGGVIICKQDGDIVCFHIYDFNLLREYLLKNTKFEQPSTGEDKDNLEHRKQQKDRKILLRMVI
ncbi:MAG: HpaII family restriction endonuclease [Saprospiraceae bacterium]|nr:HpaII family restriction endonuclease [Candidatus Vicinibacter affinis]